MQRHSIDAERLLRICARLGDTVLAPSAWPEILEDISVATSSKGAFLLQGDIRTPDVPFTPSLTGLVTEYFGQNWHTRDLRATRAVPLLLRGAEVVIDQDLITADEMSRSAFYQDFLIQSGVQWFAGIGFSAGPALWGLTIQRAPSEGPFDTSDKRTLALLSRRMTETATLSAAVGRAALAGITSALNLVPQPALALDRLGFVLDVNDAAAALFDDDIRVTARRLFLKDATSKADFNRFLDHLRLMPDTAALPASPIIIRRAVKRPLIMRILPIDGPARGPFLGGRALLMLGDIERKTEPNAQILAQVFALSPAEARVGVRIASGASVEAIAADLSLSRETVRSQLKAVFAKTGASRQSELVGLFANL